MDSGWTFTFLINVEHPSTRHYPQVSVWSTGLRHSWLSHGGQSHNGSMPSACSEQSHDWQSHYRSVPSDACIFKNLAKFSVIRKEMGKKEFTAIILNAPEIFICIIINNTLGCLCAFGNLLLKSKNHNNVTCPPKYNFTEIFINNCHCLLKWSLCGRDMHFLLSVSGVNSECTKDSGKQRNEQQRTRAVKTINSMAISRLCSF